MRSVRIAVLLLGLAGLLWSGHAPATAGDPPAANKAAPAAITGDKALTQLDDFIAKAGIDKSKPGWKTGLPKPPAITFDPAHAYYAKMVTNKGTVLIRFMPDNAPMHVTNFLYLIKLGFYDGTSFHRVITGFMAQGGDPLGNGTGGPGYGFAGEFPKKAGSEALKVIHDKPGLLSMANAGPGTDGSQFFLTFVPTPWLNGKHTVFGEVTEGMTTLKALEAAGSQSGAPTEPLKLEKVTIEVK
jgi:peptidyl-prolyl cis-trans isomerase B (cyclophilin B)